MKKFFFGSGKRDRDDDRHEKSLKPMAGETSVFLTGDERVDTTKIKLLLDTMAEVISKTDPDRLLVSIVDRCIRLVGAERGILFLKDPGAAPAIKVARDAGGRNIEGDIQFSTKVINDVFASGEPVLLKVGASEPVDFSKSVVDLKLRAVMCVTLSVKEETIGVIYVDTRAASREFAKSDLKFFDALANAMAITIENARLVAEYVRSERLKESLEIARRIQVDLLPADPESLEGFDISGRLEPLEMTAGDYYDFIPMGEDKLGIVVGDVSGHGVGPAILMSSVRSLTRALMAGKIPIDEALGFLNNQLEHDTDEDIFVSYFLGIIDFKTRLLTYGNAGHCPPILLRKGACGSQELKRTGMALGVIPDAPFGPPESIVLEKGDLLALFTDGIEEAQKEGEMFGKERFVAILANGADLPASQLIDRVFASVKEFIAHGGSGDDLTLSIVKVY